MKHLDSKDFLVGGLVAACLTLGAADAKKTNIPPPGKAETADQIAARARAMEAKAERERAEAKAEKDRKAAKIAENKAREDQDKAEKLKHDSDCARYRESISAGKTHLNSLQKQLAHSKRNWEECEAKRKIDKKWNCNQLLGGIKSQEELIASEIKKQEQLEHEFRKKCN